MLLNEWLNEGNTDPEGLKPIGNKWRDPVDGWIGMAFQFDYIGDRDDLEGTWRGENRRTKEMRAVVAIAKALSPEKPLPYDVARRRAYEAEWPIHKQMEAYAENSTGNPEKLNQMLSDFAKIRERFPKEEN